MPVFPSLEKRAEKFVVTKDNLHFDDQSKRGQVFS